MAIRSVILILLSVLLSAVAQVAFKYGMSRDNVQSVLGGGMGSLLLQMARSPAVLIGFVAYGASAMLWLSALARVDLSLAYPFVALGIVITVVAGAWAFSEAITTLRVAGVGLICAGVIVVAASHSG